MRRAAPPMRTIFTRFECRLRQTRVIQSELEELLGSLDDGDRAGGSG